MLELKLWQMMMKQAEYTLVITQGHQAVGDELYLSQKSSIDTVAFSLTPSTAVDGVRMPSTAIARLRL